MPHHRIAFDQIYATQGDYLAVGVKVLNAAGRQVHRYAFKISGTKQVQLTHRYGIAHESNAPTPLVVHALLAWGIRRLTRLLAEAPPEWDTGVIHTAWDVAEDDLPELAQTWSSKSCEFQVRERRTLLCSAASPRDETAVGTDGIHTLAPTSESLCLACRLPDSGVLCTHLTNPKVMGFNTAGGGRQLAGALCNLGNDGAVTDAANCKAGGHACWERVVELERSAVADISPLSLVTAIDYLDATWRASAHSGRKRLFQHKRAETIADLAQPCRTRADLYLRVSQLDTVLKAMAVPNLDESFKKEVREAGPLVRLKYLLSTRFAESSETEALRAESDAAIDHLLAVARVRTAMQHAATSDVDLTHALAVFGIAYPTTDWSEAWARLQAEVIGALTSTARRIDELL